VVVVLVDPLEDPPPPPHEASSPVAVRTEIALAIFLSFIFTSF
jgi:hypothetical protein